jgi:N-acetylmuramoyl-L-alanine amidase
MRLDKTGKILLWIWIALFLPGILSSQSREEMLQLRTVVIDPGHGGNDPGATSGGIREKNIVLDVGIRLGNMIKREYPGIKVIYTRSKDVFIPLHARASIANRNKADLFISLHANCVTEPSARGTETFTLGLYSSNENLEVAKKENSVILLEEDYTTNYEGFNPNETESYIMFENMQSEFQAQSIDLASRIQEAFTSRVKLTNRGVKQAGFLVLRQTTMPGVLVEMGFISNPAERKLLTSEAGKEKIAVSIFEAFSHYKKSIDSKSRFTAPLQEGVTDSGKATGETALAILHMEENQVWYSVQIGATAKALEPSEKNFRGEKSIIRLQMDSYYKYYSGQFKTAKEAFSEKTRLLKKFPDAFVVIVENGKSRPLKNSDLR